MEKLIDSRTGVEVQVDARGAEKMLKSGFFRATEKVVAAPSEKKPTPKKASKK